MARMRVRGWLAGLYCAAAWLGAQPAQAQSTVKSTPTVSPPGNNAQSLTRWYGWQTLAVDGAALATALIAIPVGGRAEGAAEVLGASAAATYLLGAPIVHGVQREPGRGLASLGLRVGLPLGLRALLHPGTYAHCPAHSEAEDVEYCQPGARDVVGVLVGALAASVVDGALLARKRIEPASAVTWSPSLSLEPKRGGQAQISVGVAAVF
jgi:hypothetical protein